MNRSRRFIILPGNPENLHIVIIVGVCNHERIPSASRACCHRCSVCFFSHYDNMYKVLGSPWDRILPTLGAIGSKGVGERIRLYT